MKSLNKIWPVIVLAILITSCEKHVIEYDATPVTENAAEFQLHYIVPVTSGAANNIYRVEINGELIANESAPLSTYNAIPNGAVGKFYATQPGNTNIKLYKGQGSAQQLVYDQNTVLETGKQNIFVHDFSKPPIVINNGFPYPKIVTEHTGTTAWVKFYNFLYESAGLPTDLKLQYQYQYVADIATGQKSDWINVGNPVAFGESTGWEPVTVIKAVEISSGSARIDYRIRLIGTDGSDQGSLKVMNSSGNFINYSDWWTGFIGRAYHHIFSGMRAANPRSAVRVFTAL